MQKGTSALGETVKLLAVVVVWAALFRGLSRYGVDLLPLPWARELTLESYLAIVQVITAGAGLALSFAVLGEPRRELALVAPRPVSVFRAAMLTPLVFVVTTGAAFQIARPTLLEELARGGAALVRQSTGEFGREVVVAPLWMALAWGAVVSPLAEELFFRGALFSLVTRLTRKRDSDAAPPSLSPELLDDGAATRAVSGVLAWLRDGGAAVLLVAVAFGVLHRDMPGGMGIVRFVSALGLGVACGVARKLTGSVAPPMLLHVLFNSLSITAARRLIVSDVFPVKSAIPTLAMLFAAIGVVAVISERAVGRRRAPSARFGRGRT